MRFRFTMLMSPKTKRRAIAAVLMAATVIAFTAVAVGLAGRSDGEEPVSGEPVCCIGVENETFTVIAILDGNTSDAGYRLFLEVCDGFGIKATLFVSENGLRDSDKINDAKSAGHAMGILCENTGSMSRASFMKYLAERNDAYKKAVGSYAKYCYVSGVPCKYASEVIGAYGQYYIKESICANDGVIYNGCIVLADISSEETVYSFARAAAKAAADGKQYETADDFLKPIIGEKG